MLPAFTLMCFNIAIAVRLQKIKRIYKAMARQHAALSLNGIAQRSSNTATSTRSKSADESSSLGYTEDNNDITTTSTMTLSQPSPEVKRVKNSAKLTLPLVVK